MEWLMKQIDRLASFLFDAKEDLQEFDEHVKAEVIKYKNKQCIKAFWLGVVVGQIAYAIIDRFI